MPHKNDALAAPTALPLKGRPEPAPEPSSSDVTDFLQKGKLLGPRQVAEELGVDVPRVRQMAQEVERLLGEGLPRTGKDRRFSAAVLAVLRRAQARSREGVTFELGLREELVARRLLPEDGQVIPGHAALQQAAGQLVRAVEDWQRMMEEFREDVRVSLQAVDHKVAGTHSTMQQHRELLQLTSKVVQDGQALAVTFSRMVAEMHKTVAQAQRYLPHERDWRQKWAVLGWAFMGAFLGQSFFQLTERLLSWLHGHLG